ncbi:MAG: HIT domain-containing protein [Candidatus Nanoarchaeia archaeon]|nr:HIT domain-containing protein [Candidatus Nanoarchaeia archaeon]
MENCFFCSLIESKDIYLLDESTYFKVLLDINPSIMGQSLILSKNHQPFFPALNIEEIQDFLKLINKLKNDYFSMGLKDFNILINNGAGAGQKIPHFSASYFPRRDDDNFSMFNLSFMNISNEQFENQFNSFKELFVSIKPEQIKSDDLSNIETNDYVPKNIIFESMNYYVFIDENQFSPGHIKILPKYLDRKINSIIELSVLLKLVPILLFEAIKPQGTNIVFDFFDNKFLIHIIPRYENDFTFNMSQIKYDFQLYLNEYLKLKNQEKNFEDFQKNENTTNINPIIKKDDLNTKNSNIENTNKDILENEKTNNSDYKKENIDNKNNNEDNNENTNDKNNDNNNMNNKKISIEDLKLDHFKRNRL